MKNKLIDLNDHLFAQLERLNDEDLTEDELKREIERSKAVTNLGQAIVANAKLALDGQKFMAEYARSAEDTELPAMLENRKTPVQALENKNS